jgi:hypothetical protein
MHLKPAPFILIWGFAVSIRHIECAPVLEPSVVAPRFVIACKLQLSRTPMHLHSNSSSHTPSSSQQYHSSVAILFAGMMYLSATLALCTGYWDVRPSDEPWSLEMPPRSEPLSAGSSASLMAVLRRFRFATALANCEMSAKQPNSELPYTAIPPPPGGLAVAPARG